MSIDSRAPVSTYRLQFHAGFTFRDAAAVVPYLHDLGVSHVYASPYLKAVPGSTHGYDVIDHCALNPELGTREDFDAFLGALERHGMSHVLDIVPNHVGVATNENRWWNDVLERGPASPYAGFFDIAWRGSPRPELHDKVLLPVLGGHYADVLERGELRVVVDGGRAAIAYFDRRFPVSRESLERRGGAVEALNGKPGDAASFDALDELLNEQHYRLAYWRVASDEINYRRFFDINDLAALSMERPEVFEATHPLILKLVAEGRVTGLRVDHPDGLYDPAAYFERLRKAAGGPVYVVAEKILAPDEPLVRSWAVSGTSGYDFLIKLNGLFIDSSAEQAMSRLYAEFTGDARDFAEHAYENKRLILERSLASQLQMLTHRLDRLAQRHRRSRDFTHNALRLALREVIACFGVYRTYVTARDGVSEADAARIGEAVRGAIARNPQTEPAVFEFVRDTLLLRTPGFDAEEPAAERLEFVGKFQQLSAPATAKGVEDTAFYRYNRLGSLNEVGGEPGHFGLTADALHAYLADRQANWPGAMSALSTHDTKRSEDVRARIDVLSEMPDEWAARVRRWAALNERHRRKLAGVDAPGRNDEYLLYQTLIGAWPFDPAEAAGEAFVGRIQAYMRKAMREAKVWTSWTDPNADYEAGVDAFVAAILNPALAGEFLEDYRGFQRRVARAGLINSLTQTLVRICAPGVPDTYQGTEMVDLSVVDPDNRRPIDYARRREALADLGARAATGGLGLVADLVRTMPDGRAKLYLTWRALTYRRENTALFAEGEYVPLRATGPAAGNVFAFARQLGESFVIVVVPRLVAGFEFAGNMAEAGSWAGSSLPLPEFARGRRLKNVLSGSAVDVGDEAVVAAVFEGFPVAMLTASE
jgi:(1->4)-alpha-D-glucan 1-alpha-D-glucosylmutase